MISEVLVLGGTGFIGKRIVARLTDTDLRVHPASRERLELGSRRDVEHLAGNVAPGTALVMCAVIRRTVDDSFDAMLRNIEMVDNVIRAFASLPIGQAIFLSSIDVYGRPPRQLPVGESSELHPTSYYGVGKAACELLFGLIAPNTVPVTILRLPGVYGVSDEGRSVIGTFLHQISHGEIIRITGDGTALRDYAHVDDVSAIVERCLAGPETGTFNVVTGRSSRIVDLVHEAGRAVGRTPALEFVPTADTAGDAVFDAKKLRAAWPDLRLRSVEEGIRQYAAEMRD